MAVLKNSNGKMDIQKEKKVHLVAQELKLTRVLAGNNKSAREKALKNLKKWFAKRTETMPFTEDDFQRIWKGLFYAMWMSDKPLVQEECAENIANLIHFPTVDTSLLFFKAGLTILNNEWNGIDQLRLDKFLMLVRRLLRQAFFVLKKHSFAHKDIEKFNSVLSSTILMPLGSPALGLLMHFIEIFMEELAKVSEGRIHQEKVCVFLKPFIEKLVTTHDGRLIAHIKKFIFTYLIRQSDLGFEYQAKYEAWKQQGFPGSIDSMQKIPLGDEKMTEDEEEESEERDKPLDPRAGRVDVEIPQLKFSAKTIASNLMNHKYDKNSTTKGRNVITVLSEQFNKLAKGVYPLGVKKILDTKNDQYDMNIRKATNRLIKFEQKLMGKDRKRKRERTAKDQEEVVIKKSKKEIQSVKDSDQEDEVLVKKSRRESRSLNDAQTDEKNKKSNNGVLHRETKTKKDYEKFSLDEDVEIKVKDKNKILKMKEMARKHSDKQTRKRKDTNRQSIVDNIECVFERNSGTWVVFDVTDCDKSEKIPTLQQSSTAKLKKVDKVVEAPSLQSKKLNGSVSDKSLVPLSEKRKLRSSKSKSTLIETSSAESEVQPVAEQPTIEGAEIHSEIKRQIFSYLIDTIKSKPSLLGLSPEKSPTKKARSFPESEWDKPLQEGEYEILIPSKKHMRKKKKTAEELDNEQKTMLNTTMNTISRSSRTESQTSPTTPSGSSTKKVKFNTRLNTSQEVHEHLAQVKCSPGIPYDASKKPTKPLLKSPVNMSPINPFYRRKLNL